MLEKNIEQKVCGYAKDKGILVYKFTSPARAAVPDRMFIVDGFAIFIEFKREGCKPTPSQVRELERLKNKNIPVFVVDNVEDGKAIIDTMLQGYQGTVLLSIEDWEWWLNS